MITDKPYYYPGEMIWFDAMIRYSNPLKRDTLSKVLHVELISPEKKVVQSTSYAITHSNVSGNLLIKGNLPSGNYYLRCYTQWMRNYGDDSFFSKLCLF